jgi:hypothetical protein
MYLLYRGSRESEEGEPSEHRASELEPARDGWILQFPRDRMALRTAAGCISRPCTPANGNGVPFGRGLERARGFPFPWAVRRSSRLLDAGAGLDHAGAATCG